MRVNPKLAIKAILCTTLFSWLFVTSFGQFNSPNNLCGGHFHDVRGKINFTFNESSLTPMYSGSKVCLWQFVPSRQWTAFRVTIENWTLPISPQCSTGSLSVNSFIDRDSKTVNRYGPFCPSQRTSFTVDGIMFILVLRIDMSSNLNGKGLVVTYTPDPEKGTTTHEYRITTMFNSYGRFSNEPIPYFAASFFAWQISTFAFIKGNFSDNLKLKMNFKSINFDKPGCNNTEICDNSTYFGIYEIQKDGRFQILETLRATKGAKEPYESIYGLYLLWIGANNTMGGGKFSLIYRFNRFRN